MSADPKNGAGTQPDCDRRDGNDCNRRERKQHAPTTEPGADRQSLQFFAELEILPERLEIAEHLRDGLIAVSGILYQGPA